MAKRPATKKLNLALQGGGAHGAFTWGVLDRLLEEETIEIAAISGTSAGAMNAAVLVDGYAEGGRERAKAQLEFFWGEVSRLGSFFNPMPANPWQGYMPPGLDWLSSFNPVEAISRSFSPYDFNPLNVNPLRTALVNTLGEPHLNTDIKLYVSATNVETGQPRLFHGEEITIEALLASACLPQLFQAIEIDGVPHWDGGYVGNPAIWPLIYKSDCDDVLLVQLNPIVRPGTPKHAIDIIARLNEITFNSSLIAEMRAIKFVKDLIAAGKLDRHDYHDLRVHLVSLPDNVHEVNATTKYTADWRFYQTLRNVGRNEMERWLKQHHHAIGERSTFDIEEHFLVKPERCKTAHATGTFKAQVDQAA